MQRNPKLLLVSPDTRLEAEVQAALKGITDTNAVLHYVPEFRLAVETARNRRPDLALIEMGGDLRALKALADDLNNSSPETTLAAVFAPQIFGHDVSESAILIEAIRAGMQDFLRRPLSRADLEQLLERLYRKNAAAPATRFGRIVSFVSNKGGVGKSTVSTNTAVALALRHPAQVLLIDASLQMGVCAALLDLKPSMSLTDAVEQRDRLDETLIRQLAVTHDTGLHLLAAPADAVEAANMDDATMSRILSLARRAYDFVIVDTFPMLDQVMMAVLDLSDRAYVVLESVVPTVLGAAKLIKLLDSLGFPRERQRIILNRYTGSADNLKPTDVALRLGRDVDHIVPNQRKLSIAANIGKPYILSATRFWGFGRALRELASEIETIRPLDRVAREAASEPAEEPRNENGAPHTPERIRHE
jgi:pilus assembly protein CpaE